MKHFVYCQNAEDSLRCLGAEMPDFFEVYSSGIADRLPGSAVWLISGDGPDARVLKQWFIVERTEPDMKDACTVHVYGERGVVFRNGIRLNDYPWFCEFHKQHGPFRPGLEPIPAHILAHFFEVAEAAGFQLPREVPAPVGDDGAYLN